MREGSASSVEWGKTTEHDGFPGYAAVVGMASCLLRMVAVRQGIHKLKETVIRPFIREDGTVTVGTLSDAILPTTK